MQITLGVCGNAITNREGRWYTHHSFGRIVDLLAERFCKVRYYAPETASASPETCDYAFRAPGITVCPWLPRRNSLQALRRPDRLIREYRRMVKESDALIFRGSAPLLWCAHWMARGDRPVVHWIVGDPIAVAKGAQRGYGSLIQAMGVQFARLERVMTRLMIRASHAHVLANGEALALAYAGDRTRSVISTTISEDDFLVREDTCRNDTVRILFVGFVRPEKGLEYLVRALPGIHHEKNVRLAIVGSWAQFPAEHERLRCLVRDLGCEDRVTWEGYAAYGADLFAQMDASDVLVLPSLSEGTPRVLVEARARSLPIVATGVGGIPSSVRDGEDGLLVPPRNAAAIASAVTRLIEDGDLRRRLIAAGRERVRRWTVDRFVDLLCELIAGDPANV